MSSRQRREEEGPADSGRPSSPLDQLKSYTTTQNTLSCDCPPSFVLLRGPGLKESSFLEDDPGVAGIFAERGKKSWFLSVHQFVPYSLFRLPKSTTTPMGGGCLSIWGDCDFCKRSKSRMMSGNQLGGDGIRHGGTCQGGGFSTTYLLQGTRRHESTVRSGSAGHRRPRCLGMTIGCALSGVLNPNMRWKIAFSRRQGGWRRRRRRSRLRHVLTNRAEQAPLWKQQNSPPPLSILHQLPHFKTLKRTCVSIIAKFNFCCRLALNLLFSSLPYMIGKVVISFNYFPIFTNSVLQQCIRLLQNVKNYKYSA